jgi:hypothetical protein
MRFASISTLNARRGFPAVLYGAIDFRVLGVDVELVLRRPIETARLIGTYRSSDKNWVQAGDYE